MLRTFVQALKAKPQSSRYSSASAAAGALDPVRESQVSIEAPLHISPQTPGLDKVRSKEDSWQSVGPEVTSSAGAFVHVRVAYMSSSAPLRISVPTPSQKSVVPRQGSWQIVSPGSSSR